MSILNLKIPLMVKACRLENLTAQSNFDCLDMNLIAEISGLLDEDEEMIPIAEKYILFDWYKDVVFVLHHHRALAELTNSKARFVKLKSLRYCIIDKNMCWKDIDGIILNCLLEEEAEKVIEEFHKGDFGGHHYWKATTNKILRAGYYWPTMFKDVYKKIASCHECQIFYGKRKLVSLPLMPIYVEVPF